MGYNPGVYETTAPWGARRGGIQVVLGGAVRAAQHRARLPGGPAPVAIEWRAAARVEPETRIPAAFTPDAYPQH